MKERLLLLVGVAILAGAVVYAMRERQRQLPLVVQPPIPFNHQQHLAAGLTCAVCHVHADTQTFAGIPRVTDCLECHSAVGAQTPLLAEIEPQLKQVAERGEEIPWKKVYRVPGHTYFSHQRHVSLAKLDCAACHGDLSKVTSPVVRQAIPVKMERCLECHRQRNVTTDCLTCHR
jgi:hypothetical protein